MVSAMPPSTYSYPLWFRFVYLWLPYAVGLGSAAWLSGSLHGPFGWARPVGVLLLLALLQHTVLQHIPTTIVVADHGVSLLRFRRYATFDPATVMSVQTDAPWVFRGWTKVVLRADGRTGFFFLSPDADWQQDFLGKLGYPLRNASIRPTKAYAWTTVRLVWYRIICIAAVLGLALVGLDIAMRAGRLTPDDIIGITIVSLGLAFTVWAIVFRTPVRVEFANDQITFVLPFGRRILVAKSDVLTARKGHHIGRLRVPGSTGTILRLRHNPTLHISTYFIDYPELASRLASLATRRADGRSGEEEWRQA